MEQARALIDVCFEDVRPWGQLPHFTTKFGVSEEGAAVVGEGGKVE
jgi:hypothetical protein